MWRAKLKGEEYHLSARAARHLRRTLTATWRFVRRQRLSTCDCHEVLRPQPSLFPILFRRWASLRGLWSLSRTHSRTRAWSHARLPSGRHARSLARPHSRAHAPARPHHLAGTRDHWRMWRRTYQLQARCLSNQRREPSHIFERLLGFGEEFRRRAEPFDWNFTREDLRHWLDKLPKIHETPLHRSTKKTAA